MLLRSVATGPEWDGLVAAHAWGHPLQLWGWGEAKRETGWTPTRLLLEDGGETAAAQVLVWRLPHTRRSIAYVPRGPVGDPASPLTRRFLAELSVWAKHHGAIHLRIEPAWTAASLPGSWRPARNSIQLAATYTIDLTRPLDELRAAMGRKHRQYVSKGQRELVVEADNAAIPAMFDIYEDTARRAGFGIHAQGYYQSLMEHMGANTRLHFVRAAGGRTPLAFLWLAFAGRTAYELFGGVTAEGQRLKANYVLKWSAITDMIAASCQVYDFNGRLNDGVGHFKAGFGPDETNYMGTFDDVFHPAWYQLWERLWPIAKPIGRRILGATDH